MFVLNCNKTHIIIKQFIDCLDKILKFEGIRHIFLEKF
jgi:hypothetical protein